MKPLVHDRGGSSMRPNCSHLTRRMVDSDAAFVAHDATMLPAFILVASSFPVRDGARIRWQNRPLGSGLNVQPFSVCETVSSPCDRCRIVATSARENRTADNDRESQAKRRLDVAGDSSSTAIQFFGDGWSFIACCNIHCIPLSTIVRDEPLPPKCARIDLVECESGTGAFGSPARAGIHL